MKNETTRHLHRMNCATANWPFLFVSSCVDPGFNYVFLFDSTHANP